MGRSGFDKVGRVGRVGRVGSVVYTSRFFSKTYRADNVKGY